MLPLSELFSNFQVNGISLQSSDHDVKLLTGVTMHSLDQIESLLVRRQGYALNGKVGGCREAYGSANLIMLLETATETGEVEHQGSTEVRKHLRRK
jgi:hypothetical protein